ncbi:MAG: DUF29 family protein [Xenococcaceae cyanobacterium MO_167.B52]|nr:DUF29 family protein [Xenococcaceae cyanobacterium MO_167.B52]
MEEILELKNCLVHQEYDRAYAIVEELEAMGRQDKINNLESFLVILLVHLIKIQVEKRVTCSWRNSISNSLLAIQKRNKLGKKSHYIKSNNWDEHILYSQFEAILGAAKEVFEGMDYQELERLVDFDKLIFPANELLAEIYTKNPRDIIESVESRFGIKRQ